MENAESFSATQQFIAQFGSRQSRDKEKKRKREIPHYPGSRGENFAPCKGSKFINHSLVKVGKLSRIWMDLHFSLEFIEFFPDFECNLGSEGLCQIFSLSIVLLC